MHNSIKQKLVRGGAWALTAKVLAALSGLAVNALLARLLTPEEMGVYFLTLSLVSIASLFAQMGMTQTVVRLVAEAISVNRPERARASVYQVIYFTVAGVSVIALALILGGGQWVADVVFHTKLMADVMHIAVIWMILLTFQSVLAETFRGFHDIRFASIFSGLTTSALSMLIFAVVWRVQGHTDLDKAILIIVVALLTSVIISTMLLGKKLNVLPATENSVSSKAVFSIAWPLWLTNLVLFVLSQADLWILGMLRSQDDVAIYGAASRLLALVAMSLLVVNSVVQPIIVDLYAQNKKQKLERMLRSTATIATIPSIMVLMLFVIWGGDILNLIFGKFYISGRYVLLILCVGQLANVWAGSCGITLMLTGHQKSMLKITILCGLIVIMGAFLLVDKYGAPGVAASAAFGMVLQNILMLVSVKRKLGIWTHFSPVYLINVCARMRLKNDN